MDVSPEPQSSVPNTSIIPPQSPVPSVTPIAPATPVRQQASAFIKFIRVFLLVLIIIGIALLCTQNYWISPLVDFILSSEHQVPVVAVPVSSTSTPSSVTPEATSTSTSSTDYITTSISSQVSGVPNFTFSYPSEYGTPTISYSPANPDSGDGPEQQLVFYKSNSPHTYPNAGSEVYMAPTFTLVSIKSGEVLSDVIDTEFPDMKQTIKDTRYSLTIDNHPAIAQPLSLSSIIYYIQFNSNSVIEFQFGGPYELNGNKLNTSDARTMQDKIMDSIKFST